MVMRPEDNIRLNYGAKPCEMLRTLKGSIIRRYHKSVGKRINNKIYSHISYINEFVPPVMVKRIEETLRSDEIPFKPNCIRYDMVTMATALVECPDFDTAREPRVGKIFIVDNNGSTSLTRDFKHIYHHKWLFVKDDYTGFDVAASWKWSRKWLSTLTEPADGSSLERWKAQLLRFNLF